MQVFTDQLPFYDIRSDRIMMLRVMKGLRPTKPSSDQALELSAEIWEVMERCWGHSPAERPSVDQVVERLSGISPTESTLRRMKMEKLKRKRDVKGYALTPLSFRVAMRGQNTIFSDAEINLLQECAGDSTANLNTPVGADHRDASTYSLLDAAATDTAPGGIDNSEILNESQAALEAVSFAAGAIKKKKPR